jgi:hypothetical protein
LVSSLQISKLNFAFIGKPSHACCIPRSSKLLFDWNSAMIERIVTNRLSSIKFSELGLWYVSQGVTLVSRLTFLAFQRWRWSLVSVRRKSVAQIRSKLSHLLHEAVCLEKLTVPQLVKFTTCYGTRRFITLCTTAHHCSLFWAWSLQSTPSKQI